MAESAAAALVNVIFEKLANEAFNAYVRSQGIHSELDELQTTLRQIEALLNDASSKEVTDQSVELWLKSLQHLAYDIDDVLDDVATEAMHRELTHESEAITSKVRKLIVPTCCTNISLSHRLSHKLDGINKKLQHLEKQKGVLGLIVKDEKKKNNNRGNESSLLESDVVGRESEKEILLNNLLRDEPSSKENFSILPIVGMGGVGKTTLARLLYNDTKVKGRFELHAWVCVSDDFDIFKISKTIYQALPGENKECQDLNQLQVALKEKVKDKQFLLVVDDVWNENYDDWEVLVRPFHSCARGSRIIMTTRKEQLLKTLGFDHLDHLDSLSHKDALSLLAQYALGGVDNFDSHPTLRPKGEGLVGKCGCLPLALKAIGRLLRTKTDEEDWDEVLNSEVWDLENAKDIVPALRLSYHDLSTDLKQLFAYCSLFPKDFLFDKEDLVLLWMAEGYLNQSPPNKQPERLGHEYFEKLLSRSFFQYAPNDKSYFVMHDLMNDLATFVAGEYFLRFDKQTKLAEEALAKYRHMSFIKEKYLTFRKFEAFKSAKSLRTLLPVFVGEEQSWERFYLSGKILDDLIPRLSLLRVLSLRRFTISEVPEFIGNMKHLRYLNLSQTNISELPENVGNLYNLQTLIVFGCKSLNKLPKSFVKLKKLRHFDTRDTPLLKKLPLGIAELRSLQTLSKIIIEGEDGFEITELKGLLHIHGEVSIKGLHNVQSVIHAREANLSLRRFTKLELEWADGSQRGILDKEVLNELKPHTDTLKTLGVEFYAGIEFPGWIGDPSFCHLGYVSIRGCRKCISLPPLGQLPSLKELFIQGMDEVKVIGIELTRTTAVAFPSLEILRFEDMSGWEVWSTKSDVLNAVYPCLRELHIQNCPKLSVVSLDALPLLRALEIDGCGDGVLRSLVSVASSITWLKIESISGLTDEVWRGAMKYLGAVEEVRINKCNEIRYLWESESESRKVLVNLKELRVWSCDNLVSLGEKEEEDDDYRNNLLSSLMVLDVDSCKKMERCCCPNSIERLSIHDCESLTHLYFPTTAIQGGGQKLKSLNVVDCYKLMEKINNTSMPILESILIYGWTNLKSVIQLGNFIHLTRLSIINCPGIETFPDVQLSTLTLLKRLTIRNCPGMDASFPRGLWPQNLVSLRIGGLRKPISEWGHQNFPTSLVDLDLIDDEPYVSNFGQLTDLLPSSLTNLRIERFDKLESLSMGLQHLTSLQHLTIWNCAKMKHLPETLLPSLLSLTIDECPTLESLSMGLQHLTSLQHLTIGNCPKMKHLPETLLPSLLSLVIYECPELESLPMGVKHLTSLQHLTIDNCPKMKHLPETLLPSLLSLEISGCPKLKERCNGRGSRYWPLISHIPCIQIDNQNY